MCNCTNIKQMQAKLDEAESKIFLLRKALSALDDAACSDNISQDNGWNSCTPWLDIPPEVRILVDEAMRTTEPPRPAGCVCDFPDTGKHRFSCAAKQLKIPVQLIEKSNTES